MFKSILFIIGLCTSVSSFAAADCKSLFQTCMQSCASRDTCQNRTSICSIFGRTEDKDQGALKCEYLWGKDVEPNDVCAASVYASQKQGKCTGMAF